MLKTSNHQKLEAMFTEANALRWEASPEKWCFGTYLLDAADMARKDVHV